jgi:hypothetical protein
MGGWDEVDRDCKSLRTKETVLGSQWRLSEILDQVEVAVAGFVGGKQPPAAVGGDAEAVAEGLVNAADRLGLAGGELVEGKLEESLAVGRGKPRGYIFGRGTECGLRISRRCPNCRERSAMGAAVVFCRWTRTGGGEILWAWMRAGE